MQSRSKTVAAFALAAVGAFALSSWTFGQVGPEKSGAEAEIRKLLTEKRDVLQTRFEAAQQLFDLGTVQHERVLAAERDMLAARVELAASADERLEVLRLIVENAEKFERLMAQRYRNGTGGQDESLLATAARLDTQIALLRAQSSP